MKTIALALVAAFLLIGCNTFAGFGKDIEAVGQVFQSTVQDSKDAAADKAALEKAQKAAPAKK